MIQQDSQIEGLTTGVGSAVGTALLPGIRTAVGGFLGSTVGKLFSGHAYDATGMFTGLHSPTLPALDDTQMYKDDAKVYVDYANALGISVEEVKALITFDSTRPGSQAASAANPYAYSFDAWRSTIDSTKALGWIRGYNAANPGAKIVPGQMGPQGAIQTVLPQTSSPLSNASIGNYSTGTVASPVSASSAIPSSYAAQVASNYADTPSLATPPFVASNTPIKAAGTKSEVSTYAMIGGGALLVIVILVLLLKKK